MDPGFGKRNTRFLDRTQSVFPFLEGALANEQAAPFCRGDDADGAQLFQPGEVRSDNDAGPRLDVKKLRPAGIAGLVGANGYC